MLKVAISRIPLKETCVAAVKHMKYPKCQTPAIINEHITSCKSISTTTKQTFSLNANLVSISQVC